MIDPQADTRFSHADVNRALRGSLLDSHWLRVAMVLVRPCLAACLVPFGWESDRQLALAICSPPDAAPPPGNSPIGLLGENIAGDIRGSEELVVEMVARMYERFGESFLRRVVISDRPLWPRGWSSHHLCRYSRCDVGQRLIDNQVPAMVATGRRGAPLQVESNPKAFDLLVGMSPTAGVVR